VETAGGHRWTILGARHAGITVSDLDRSLEFYCGKLGLELLWRRLHEERDIAEITGVPEASAFDIAMLRIPGSDVEVELIEYKGCERHSGSARPCDYGTGHFAFFVEDIEGLYSDLASRGVAFRSDGPVAKSSGGKSLYSLDPDGYVIEFSERAT
jgi:catechol 2,3-dioxygenase-like lactoylglutathione lyase family enzyme